MTILNKLILILAIAGAGMGAGVALTTWHYAPIVAMQDAALTTIDTATKETKLTQEKDNAKIFKDAENRIARIDAHYKRLLHAKGDNSPDSTTGGKPLDDGTLASGDTPGDGRGLDFEYACLKVASALLSWHEYGVRHNVPVE